jgi:hypothetical protein
MVGGFHHGNIVIMPLAVEIGFDVAARRHCGLLLDTPAQNEALCVAP